MVKQSVGDQEDEPDHYQIRCARLHDRDDHGQTGKDEGDQECDADDSGDPGTGASCVAQMASPRSLVHSRC